MHFVVKIEIYNFYVEHFFEICTVWPKSLLSFEMNIMINLKIRANKLSSIFRYKMYKLYANFDMYYGRTSSRYILN